MLFSGVVQTHGRQWSSEVRKENDLGLNGSQIMYTGRNKEHKRTTTHQLNRTVRRCQMFEDGARSFWLASCLIFLDLPCSFACPLASCPTRSRTNNPSEHRPIWPLPGRTPAKLSTSALWPARTSNIIHLTGRARSVLSAKYHTSLPMDHDKLLSA